MSTVAGDLTVDDVRQALGADADVMTEDEIEALRQTANVMSALVCAAFRRAGREVGTERTER